MSREVSLEQVTPLLQEILASGGRVAMAPKGVSMRPMLGKRCNKVVLTEAPARLQKYDIPLYRRTDGRFVLHRVVAVREDGYVLCGDNQIVREYGIGHHQVLAVVDAFYYRGRYIKCRSSLAYGLYCRIWVALLPLRRLYRRGRAMADRVRRSHNPEEHTC